MTISRLYGDENVRYSIVKVTSLPMDVRLILDFKRPKITSSNASKFSMEFTLSRLANH